MRLNMIRIHTHGKLKSAARGTLSIDAGTKHRMKEETNFVRWAEEKHWECQIAMRSALEHRGSKPTSNSLGNKRIETDQIQ